MLGAVLIVFLVLALIGAVPASHSRQSGYFPNGGLGLLVTVLVILMLSGRVVWGRLP